MTSLLREILFGFRTVYSIILEGIFVVLKILKFVPHYIYKKIYHFRCGVQDRAPQHSTKVLPITGIATQGITLSGLRTLVTTKKAAILYMVLIACTILLMFIVFFGSIGEKVQKVNPHTHDEEAETNPLGFWKLNYSLVQTEGKPTAKRFLAIGIPSVRRENGYYYLMQTIYALLGNSLPEEKDSFTIIIFLADPDKTYNDQAQNSIRALFKPFLQSGLLHVIQASRDLYPRLHNLGHKFEDSDERTRWRSKQAIDFALLFSYAHNMSTYYIQLEDDVMCAPGYMGQIRNTIVAFNANRTRTNWGLLSFSLLGFIGKLFRSSDLEQLSSFFMLFYSEMPVDWMVHEYLRIKHQPFVKAPVGLFQHMGMYSSLRTKQQDLIDNTFPALYQNQIFFKSTKKLPNIADINSNPDAMISTSMGTPDSSYTLENFYHTKNGLYWANSVKKDAFISIIFKTCQIITRIQVTTGILEHPRDVLIKGGLYIGQAAYNTGIPQNKKRSVCTNVEFIGNFENGAIDARVNQSKCACLQIVSLEDHINWVIFKSIAIETKT